MKFGGVAVANGTMIRSIAGMINQFREECMSKSRQKSKSANGTEIIVVTSALSTVTDMLLENAGKIAEEGDIDEVNEFVEEIRDKHDLVASEAIASKNELESVKAELREKVAEMEKALIGICLLGELTPRSLDYISSFGERLTTPILAGTLRSIGIDAVHLTGGEAGIITNEEYGNAQLADNVEQEIRARLIPLLSDKIPVVAGFIGETERGIMTTLGRGGSDYTATIIGAAVDADEIWLWKETEGIMSADPKIVKNARRIPYISYIEAMELSYFGGSILHPRAISPVIKKEIPIRVKKLFNLEDVGTLIRKETEKTKRAAKAVTLIEDTSIINLTGTGVRRISEVAAHVFSVLAANNIDSIMTSQGSSELALSLVVKSRELGRAISAIRSINAGGRIIRDFTSDSNVCAIGIVGAGMVGTPGVAGKIFSALGNEGISVIMIAQGSSEFNISLVVRKEDAYNAVQAVHDVFGMGSA